MNKIWIIISREYLSRWAHVFTHSQVAELLIDRGATTGVAVMCAYGNLGQLRARLAEPGADVDAPDWMGESGLLLAVRRGRDTEIVGLLLEHGADPDRANSAGDTPRSLAEQRGTSARYGL